MVFEEKFLIFLKKYSKSEKNWWKRGELLMLNRPLGLQITNSANDRDVLSGSLTRDYLIIGLGAVVISIKYHINLFLKPWQPLITMKCSQSMVPIVFVL